MRLNIHHVDLTTSYLRKSTSSSESYTSMSSSDDGSADADTGTGYVELTLNRLQSLHANGTVPKNQLCQYAQSGMSAKRVKQSVTKPCCQCMCKLPVKILYHLCIAFWTLTKQSQDSCLWSIQNESGSEKKKQWYLEGPKHLTVNLIVATSFKLYQVINSSCLQDILCVAMPGPI